MNKEILDKYKKSLKANGVKGRYDVYMRVFLEFSEENNIDIYNISLNDINEFIIHLKEKDMTPDGINNYIRSIKNFYKFLNRHGLVDKNILEITDKLKMLKTTRKIKDYITSDELDEILEMGMTFHDNLMYPLKMKTLLYFMYYTGIRLGELLALERKDFNLEENSAVIKEPVKNYNEGLIFYTDKVKELLKQYFRVENEKFNAFNVKRHHLHYLLQQLEDFAPAGQHITPHTFRHSFGMMLARKGVDLAIAQKLLRHKNIEDTLIYYDPDIPTIKKAYNNKINKESD